MLLYIYIHHKDTLYLHEEISYVQKELLYLKIGFHIYYIHILFSDELHACALLKMT